MNRDPLFDLPPNPDLARRLNRLAAAVTVLVLGLVVAMRYIRIPLPEGWSTAWLPAVYSAINLGVFLLLVVARRRIRHGNVRGHRQAINLALCGSLVFLVMYVAYHVTSDPVRFEGTGAVRVIYLALLASHIALAGLSLPFILFTWILGTTAQYARHRRMAVWVWPVWLYVALTGPVCWVVLNFFGRSG